MLGRVPRLMTFSLVNDSRRIVGDSNDEVNHQPRRTSLGNETGSSPAGHHQRFMTKELLL
jgi:hypothetical protein